MICSRWSVAYLRPITALLFAIVLLTTASAQRGKPKAPAPPPAPKPLELSYTVAFPQPHTHLYKVMLEIANVSTAELDLNLPTWTPGSYLQREYARHIQDFAANDETDQPLAWRKTDKATWRVTTGASAGAARLIRIHYRVYANELATQTSHLDATHAYFNGASLFMYVANAKDRPHRIRFITPEGWRVSSPLALQPDAGGWYTAADYDRLIDAPTEIGTHRLLEFTVREKLHRVAIWGEFHGDEQRLTGDLAKIVEAGAQIFGGLPYEHYLFIIHVQPGIGGGTEHINSNVSMTTPAAFKTERGYKSFLGLESHEYFHHWNVKRIRPAALGPFDYQRENYTRGLWVSEGVTSYYGDLLLRRAGLTTPEEYLNGLATMLAVYEQTPGRFKQSAESASFDAWIKLYRPDENSPNTAMSYYTKGEILGLLFDLEIRSLTGGAKSLDDVMRRLLENHGLPKPGFTDAELKATLDAVAGADLDNLWRSYVSGFEEIDFAALLSKAGLQLSKGYQLGTPYANSKTEKPGMLGIRTRLAGDRVLVANTLAGLPAYEGGLNTGDELVAIDGLRVDAANSLERLSDLRAGQRVTLTFFRRERLTSLELIAAPKPFDRYSIAPMKEASGAQTALRVAWLNEK
jgi:predicted metalloprotease with PDZ domain